MRTTPHEARRPLVCAWIADDSLGPCAHGTRTADAVLHPLRMSQRLTQSRAPHGGCLPASDPLRPRGGRLTQTAPACPTRRPREPHPPVDLRDHPRADARAPRMMAPRTHLLVSTVIIPIRSYLPSSLVEQTKHVRDGYDGPANPTRRWTTEIILVSRHPHPVRRPREPHPPVDHRDHPRTNPCAGLLHLPQPTSDIVCR